MNTKEWTSYGNLIELCANPFLTDGVDAVVCTMAQLAMNWSKGIRFGLIIIDGATIMTEAKLVQLWRDDAIVLCIATTFSSMLSRCPSRAAIHSCLSLRIVRMFGLISTRHVKLHLRHFSCSSRITASIPPARAGSHLMSLSLTFSTTSSAQFQFERKARHLFIPNHRVSIKLHTQSSGRPAQHDPRDPRGSRSL